ATRSRCSCEPGGLRSQQNRATTGIVETATLPDTTYRRCRSSKPRSRDDVMPCSSTHSARDEACLSELEDRLRGAPALTPRLLSDITAQACARVAGPHEVARAGIERLIRSGAWTDAALALVELELPRWRVRRLVHDGGEWRRAFSHQRTLPPRLHEIARTRDASPPA